MSNELETRDESASGRRGRRILLGLLVAATILMVAGLGFGIWAFLSYSPFEPRYNQAVQDKKSLRGELNQTLLELNNTRDTYDSDRVAIANQDSELMLFMMNKLADLAGDKEAKTQLAQFGVMKSAFESLAQIAQITEVPAQRTALCLNSTVSDAFNVTSNITGRYVAVCSNYTSLEPIVPRYQQGSARIAEFQAAFNSMFMALVELDNVISADP